MNKDDIKALLKDNLTITLHEDQDYDGKKLRVSISFDGEEVCNDYLMIESND